MESSRMKIHRAIRNGDKEAVLAELRAGVSVNLREEDSCALTPLLVAANSMAADVGMLQLLVERGADVNAVSAFGRYSALYLAGGDDDKLQYLLSVGAKPGAVNSGSQPFPYNATLTTAELLLKTGYDPTKGGDDDLDLAAQLISLGFPTDKVGSMRCPSRLEYAAKDFEIPWLRFFEKHQICFESLEWNPLIREIVLGSAESVATQLELAPDLNRCDCWNRTPFMLAVRSGDLIKAQLLLMAGGHSGGRSSVSKAVLECAIESQSAEMLNWLFSLDREVNLDDDDCAPLMTAARVGSAQAVKILLEHGADVFAVDQCDIQAINCSSNIEVVKVLVAAGADINRVDGTGMFLLKAAVESEDIEFLRGLIELGADVNNPNFGATALHQAVNYDRPDMIKLLLAAGADPNIAEDDHGGYRPLCNARSREAARLLLEAGADQFEICNYRPSSAAAFHKNSGFADLFTWPKNRGIAEDRGK